MEILVVYLLANPQVATALAGAVCTLGASLSVAVSKRFGGERFKLAKQLFRLVTTGKDGG